MVMRLIGRAGAIFDYIINSLAVLAGILIVFIMLLVSSDVLGRFLLNRPIVGAMEISEITLVGITFLGAAWLLRREGHVKLDVLVNRLKPRSQDLLNALTSIIGVVICLVLIWYGAKVSLDHLQRGIFEIESVLQLPTFPRYTIITVGSFLLSIQFLKRSYGYFRSWREASPSKE